MAIHVFYIQVTVLNTTYIHSMLLLLTCLPAQAGCVIEVSLHVPRSSEALSKLQSLRSAKCFGWRVGPHIR